MFSFGSSTLIVLVFHDSEFAQPANVFFGHLLGIVIGILFNEFLGMSYLTLGLSVGTTVTLMIYFKISVSLDTLFALLGIFFIIINGAWFTFLLGILCARFRDLNPTIASLVTLSFFLTPIIWNPSLIPERAFILLYNPFYHFVESVRAPLLGTSVDIETWCILTTITVLGWVFVIPAVSKMSRKLVYWL